MAGSGSTVSDKTERRIVILCDPSDKTDTIELEVVVPVDCCVGELFAVIREARQEINDRVHIALLDWRIV